MYLFEVFYLERVGKVVRFYILYVYFIYVLGYIFRLWLMFMECLRIIILSLLLKIVVLSLLESNFIL